MDPISSLDFAAAARTLTRAAQRAGLVGPSYRCPPRLVGVDRSIRRRGRGAVVSVRLRGRPMPAVLADMVEGVVVANRLSPPASDRVRAALWEALGVSAPDQRVERSSRTGPDAARPAAAGRGRPAGTVASTNGTTAHDDRNAPKVARVKKVA